MVCFERKYIKTCSILILWFSILNRECLAQNTFQGLEHLFLRPAEYIVPLASQAPRIDGDISEDAWKRSAWTTYFTDIEGESKPTPRFHTRVKMLWDKSFLYIAAELQEPHIWANLKQHDEVVFYDNDFEVFIDPDNNTHQYFEIEVNALNTIFDLFLAKPYRNNSAALIGWNAPGLKSAIKIFGTINDASDIDSAWTVEMAIPFRALSVGDHVTTPADGDIWRINFSRVEWDIEIMDGKYVKKKDASGKSLPENNWVWSPQGVINMHFPERWGYIQFSENARGPDGVAFQLPYSEKQRKYLWLIYYRQKEFFEKNRKYALSLGQLGFQRPEIDIDGRRNILKMEATKAQFTAVIRTDGSPGITINEDGLVETLRPI